MAKFDPDKRKDEDKDAMVVPEAWTEPRCHVCMSKYRKAIDRMVALGTSFSEISRIFGGEIDRRSISNHAQKHLAYEQAAIRTIIEQETFKSDEDAELGIDGITKRRVYLNTALHRAFEDLVSGKLAVEPRDAINIIEALNRFDQATESAQLETIRVQFNAFLQAIREISTQRGDPSLGNDINLRAREIYSTAPGQIRKTPQLEI